jgi:deoxyadenosine/deoxycytidine kinase
MKNYYIALAGNIGAGKTSFTKVLAKRLGWQISLEAVDENPYLYDFYRDMKTWAYHSQLFYLGQTVKTHHQNIQRQYSVIQDRTFYENAEIFSKNLYQQGLISARDWETYRALYHSALNMSTAPDLIIYLKANVETLTRRILERGREAEKTITLDYLKQLNTLYDEWIDNYSLCPTLTIPIENTELRDREEEQDQVIAKIWDIITNKAAEQENHDLILHWPGQKTLDLNQSV